MREQRYLAERAERQVDTAAVVAFLVGSLSLVMALVTWEARVYIDLETLISIGDALLVLLLALLLLRGWRGAAPLLLLMAFLGVAFTVWRGLPTLAVVPQVATAIFYARAIAAQRYLAGLERGKP